MTVACIVVAAGSGERLGAGKPKALVVVGETSLAGHACQAVAASGVVHHLVVVSPAGLEKHLQRLGDTAATHAGERPAAVPASGGDLMTARATGHHRKPTLVVVAGGATRQQSVRHGLEATPAEADVVLVHDAARCFAPPALIAQVVAAVRAGADAVVPAVPVVDTLVEVDESGDTVVSAPDRSRLRAVQTPQGFRRQALEDAHVAATERGDQEATDDAGLVRRLGVKVEVIPGADEAFKITTPRDLERAEALLATRRLR